MGSVSMLITMTRIESDSITTHCHQDLFQQRSGLGNAFSYRCTVQAPLCAQLGLFITHSLTIPGFITWYRLLLRSQLYAGRLSMRLLNSDIATQAKCFVLHAVLSRLKLACTLKYRVDSGWVSGHLYRRLESAMGKCNCMQVVFCVGIVGHAFCQKSRSRHYALRRTYHLMILTQRCTFELHTRVGSERIARIATTSPLVRGQECGSPGMVSTGQLCACLKASTNYE